MLLWQACRTARATATVVSNKMSARRHHLSNKPVIFVQEK